MPTRTAPAVDGTPNNVRVSMSLVDYTGDIRTVSFYAPNGILDATIEALVVALQAITNASVYKVEVSQVYEGAALKSNADEIVWENVHDNLVYHVKASATQSQRGYVPAPLQGVFVDGTDNPNVADAGLIAYMSAFDAAVGGTYSPVSIRFSKRRDSNDAVLL